MLKPAQRELLACLEYIQAHGPRARGYGICGNVEDAIYDRPRATWPWADVDEVGDALADLFVTLGLNPSYPVVGGRKAYQEADDLWLRDDPYGQARWALLDRCIIHLRVRE